MWPNPQFPAFTEDILNGKVHFLCNVPLYYWYRKTCFKSKAFGELVWVKMFLYFAKWIFQILHNFYFVCIDGKYSKHALHVHPNALRLLNLITLNFRCLEKKKVWFHNLRVQGDNKKMEAMTNNSINHRPFDYNNKKLNQDELNPWGYSIGLGHFCRYTNTFVCVRYCPKKRQFQLQQTFLLGVFPTFSISIHSTWMEQIGWTNRNVWNLFNFLKKVADWIHSS